MTAALAVIGIAVLITIAIGTWLVIDYIELVETGQTDERQYQRRVVLERTRAERHLIQQTEQSIADMLGEIGGTR